MHIEIYSAKNKLKQSKYTINIKKLKVMVLPDLFEIF